MKIYVVGAHSCGKSTLARYISEKYDMPLLSEVARTVLAEKELSIDSLRSNINIVDDYQQEIFIRQIKQEYEKDNFISDRSIDSLAYTAQHSRILSKLLGTLEFKKYVESLKEKNTLIFFVRPSKATLKDDGVRETLNWEGIIAIDSIVKFLLEMCELRYFTINTDSMQERIRLVESILSLTKNQ